MKKNFNEISPSLPDKKKEYCIATALFLSGFISLVYEICWIKKSSLLFGSTLEALSTVTAVYFVGLASGSWFFGKKYSLFTQPIRSYAILQWCIVIAGGITPFLFYISNHLYSMLYSFSLPHPLFHIILLIGMIAVILFIPTFFMGGILPLVTGYFGDRERKHLFSINGLYGINTLGGLIGCFASGFLFIPSIGIKGTIWFASIIGFICGCFVYFMQFPPIQLSKNLTPLQGEKNKKMSASPITHEKQINPIIMMVLFFLTGWVALGNEMLWTRYLSLIVHNTVYTYTIVLSVILAGIVLGSFLSLSLLLKRRNIPIFYFIASQLIMSFSILVLLFIPPNFWQTMVNTEEPWRLTVLCVMVLLLPSIMAGVSFPSALRVVIQKPMDTGKTVGTMSAYNIAGSIAGSLCFGFFIIPYMGIHKGILTSSAVSLLIGLSSLFFLVRFSKVLIYTGTLVTLFLWGGFSFSIKHRLPGDFLAGTNQLLEYKESKNSFLAVVKDSYNDTILEIDRLWQGSVKKTRQLMAAHVPMMLHKEPRSVCVVGLGTGQTASQFLDYGIDTLVCIDIEDYLPEIMRRYFHGAWLSDPRVAIVVEDGRTYLTHTKKTYDIISIEVGQLFRPQCTPFYSKDFYEAIKPRVRQGGLVSQFIPLEFLDTDQFLSMIASFIDVFPNSILWFNENELLLIGSPNSEPTFSKKRFEQRVCNRTIENRLQFSYWGGAQYQVKYPEVFCAGFLCGKKKLSEISALHKRFSDDKPDLEYTTARLQGAKPQNLFQMNELLSKNLDPFDHIHADDFNDSLFGTMEFIRRYNLRNTVATELFKQYMATGDYKILSDASTANPYNLGIQLERGLSCARNNEFEQAEHQFNTILSIDSTFSMAYNNLGLIALTQGNIDKAMYLYSKAIYFDSTNIQSYMNLGESLLYKDSLQKAEYLFSKALQLDPNNSDACSGLLSTRRKLEKK